MTSLTADFIIALEILDFSSAFETHLGGDFRSVQLRDGGLHEAGGNGGDGPVDAQDLDMVLHNRFEKRPGCFWRTD